MVGGQTPATPAQNTAPSSGGAGGRLIEYITSPTAAMYGKLALASFTAGFVFTLVKPYVDRAVLKRRVGTLANSDVVVVFMKGTASEPKCGYSKKVVDALTQRNIPFTAVNILEGDDEESQEFRSAVKAYSSWPTFPQVFVDGALLGGCDVITEMSADDWTRVEDRAKPIGTVTYLATYPVKSCGPVPAQKHDVGPRGFVGDRDWMIVRDDPDSEDPTVKRFITQRTHPKMCWIGVNTTSGASALELTWRNGTTLQSGPDDVLVAPAVTTGPRQQVAIWNDICMAVDQGDTAADWLSARLECRVRLVRMAAEHKRSLEATHLYPKDKPNNLVTGFADAFPYLVTTEHSLEFINSKKSGEALPMQRFRPNIVVGGDFPAWAEDQWQTLQIGGDRRGGGVVMDLVKACERCKLTTVDPVKGTVGTQESEPLVTLMKHRDGSAIRQWVEPERKLGGPYFGWNGVTRKHSGSIKVGDPVYLVRRKTPFPPPPQ